MNRLLTFLEHSPNLVCLQPSARHATGLKQHGCMHAQRSLLPGPLRARHAPWITKHSSVPSCMTESVIIALALPSPPIKSFLLCQSCGQLPLWQPLCCEACGSCATVDRCTPFCHPSPHPAAACCVVLAGSHPSDNHWAVRREAAALLSTIARHFAAPHHNLQPRLCRVLAQALLDADKPLTSKYGAVVGLQVRQLVSAGTGLGRRTVEKP